MNKQQKILQSTSATTVYALISPMGGKRALVSSLAAIGNDAACKFGLAKMRIIPVFALAVAANGTAIRLTVDSANTVKIGGHTVADGDLLVIGLADGTTIVRALSSVAAGGAGVTYLTATITAPGVAIKVGSKCHLVRLTGNDIDQIEITNGSNVATPMVVDAPIFVGDPACPILLSATAASGKVQTVSATVESVPEGE
jgi:hypothetical protein